MAPKPQIVMGGEGLHNEDLDKTLGRVEKSQMYRDLSTVMVVPTRGKISARVVESWMGLLTPMNQKFMRMFVSGMEVGAAYSAAIEAILEHPELSTWKYVLTVEEDNIPPPDGLLKLYESMDDYDVVSGLYWLKGPAGQPMMFGEPEGVLNFRPVKPELDTVQQVRGLGMGFNLFKLDLFRDERIPRPWFQTYQHWAPGEAATGYTQDLYFYENISKLGYKVACDTSIRVGHYDYEADIVW